MKNLLLVDDEKIYLMSLSEGLKQYDKNFNILTAENGRQAVDLLEAIPVDLMVTDLKMPEMDGFELLIYVLKNQPDLPVIVVTAFSNPDVIERLNALGFCHFIEKPLEFEDLLDNIQYLLDQGRTGRPYNTPKTNIWS